jgi:hypothetical protein
MSNDEVFTAFREFLELNPRLGAVDIAVDTATAMGIMEQFASAIGPVPLAEATIIALVSRIPRQRADDEKHPNTDKTRTIGQFPKMPTLQVIEKYGGRRGT